MKKRGERINVALSRICLVDWVLILFMAVLLCCMALHLFDGIAVSQDTSTIDIIVRTSAHVTTSAQKEATQTMENVLSM